MPIKAYLLLSYHLIVNYIQDLRQTREANERAAALRFRLVVLKARCIFPREEKGDGSIFFVEIRGQVYTSNKMACPNTFIKKKNLEIPLRHALSVFSRIDLSEV